ncbi:nociceptin receptor isoform X2 [Neovison vison]|uniref:nociceptin receptor isoform X2 n=1 Tax=Neovison vison TaxID=452646 RepID=UPI001CF00426|nr:nociceptin receptor isoform X2 [Neogale vison]
MCPCSLPGTRWLCTQGGRMESLFPAPFWEVLYSGHLQGNLSLLSPNHSLLPPHLLLNASHAAFLPLGLKVTIVGLYLAVCIGGLLGNCLVMYVILRHTKMKTATNIYIFNLALADTLVLLTLPFQGTDVLLGFWPFGNALCKTVIAIDYYNMFTSTFTLTAMSVDRYVAICHPIRALDVRTSSKAQAVNVAIWALASVVGVPVAIMGSAQRSSVWWRSPPPRTTGAPCLPSASSSSPSSSLYSSSPSATASWSGGCVASACSPAPARKTGTCGASRGWCWWSWPCSWAAGRLCRSSCWHKAWGCSRAARPLWLSCASARRSATSTAASTPSSTPSWMRISRPASESSAVPRPCAGRRRCPTVCAALPRTWPWPARLLRQYHGPHD